MNSHTQFSGFKTVKNCRICHSTNLYKFLDLGTMPLANSFRTKEDLRKTEKQYPLYCLFCQNCGLMQLGVVVNPNLMFRNYLYIPSGSRVMINNFVNLAHEASKKIKLSSESLVIDIGSNDGTLLTFFKRMGVRVLGIDPAKNLAEIAAMRGMPTEAKFFNFLTAKYIKEKYGKANLVCATNVVAHIDDLEDFFQGLSTLLSDKGLFICEFPYLLDLITKNQFDTIYHEHLSYFSLGPWQRLMSKYNFEIIDVARLSIHGGSVRLTQRKKSKNSKPSEAINHLISLEKQYGLYNPSSYDLFSKRVFKLSEQLRKLLLVIKARGDRIIGFGAAAKGNVLTNFINIGPAIVDYIADSTTYKWGLYTPGKHILIYPEERVFSDFPDFGLILAWNFADEIMRKQKKFRNHGGKFVIPIPQVRII